MTFRICFKKNFLLERRRVFIGFQANSLVLKSRLWHINRQTRKTDALGIE